MKKLFLIPILLFTIYSCSKDEETQAPTNSVQTTTPEKAAVKYTLTVTEANGGNVTGGGTYDDGTEISITATPNEGYLFVGWEPIDEIGNLYSQTISLTLNSDVEITPIFIMAVSIFQFNDIIIKRENNQSDCEYGGFKLTIGKDINSNKLKIFIKMKL